MKYFIPALFVSLLSLPTISSAQNDSTQKQINQTEEMIPTITATSDDLSESMSSQNVSSMLAATHDIYAATAAFRLRQGGFRYRGYSNSEFSTVINGVLINDPENGGVFWGVNGALNDILHNRDGNIGLSPSMYAFGGLGGSYHVDTRPAGQRPGLNVAYTATDRSYFNRLSASYSTGYIKGWAVSLAFSRRWATKGYEPGTYFDGYGYYFAVERKIASNQSLTLTAFGTPTTSARSAAAVSEMQAIAGDHYYNPDWGYQNGQVRSSNVNRRFEPQFMLTHEVTIKEKTNIITGASFDFGKNRTSMIDYYNSATPDPEYYRNLPSFIENPVQSALAASIMSSDINERQINWDQLITANKDSNYITPNGRQSSYVLADKVQEAKRFNLNSTLNHTFNEHVSLTAGLTYQWEKVRNYKQLTDLLGGDYFVNLNDFALQDFPTNPDVLQNDLLHPNRILHVGDIYGYDYYSQIHKPSAWIQPYFKFNHVVFFVAAQLSDSYYWRTGNVENGVFKYNSLGDSKKVNFLNYAFKAGLEYLINGKSYIYLNGEAKTAPPSFNNTFISPEVRNDLVPNLTHETVYSGELGYQFKSQKFKFKASLFYTQFTNAMHTYTFFHEDYRTNVNYNLSGIDTRHYGGEIGVEAKIYKGLSADFVANIGHYQYSGNPLATITQNNSSEVLALNQTSYLKNYFLGGMPQACGSIGLKYSGRQGWYVGIDFNYFGWNFVEVNPVRRTLQAIDLEPYGSEMYNDILHQELTKNQFTIDMRGGYNWNLNRTFGNIDKKGNKHNYYLVFNALLSNLTNNQNLVTLGYEQLRFDFQEKNLNEFPTKYRYMHGFGYFISVAFRMQ